MQFDHFINFKTILYEKNFFLGNHPNGFGSNAADSLQEGQTTAQQWWE